MAQATRPLIIVSDVHLSPGGNAHVADALAALVEASPGVEVVVAGDALDLSLLPASAGSEGFVTELMRGASRLRSAMAAHLRRGDPITFIAGNHDAPLELPGVKRALLAGLDVQETASLSIEPWFIRRGSLHIEHGHAYDPDNAPSHPLTAWSPGTEPLGIALTRRFLVPSGAMSFKHAHQTTPLQGLLDCFKRYGQKAPSIVAQYFWTAGSLCWEARSNPALASEHVAGEGKVSDFASQYGLAPAGLHRLTAEALAPRHRNARDMFLRLYFDRTIPTASLACALPFAIAGSPVALGVASVSLAVLAVSLAGGISRYDGEPERRLRDAAALVRSATGAAHVVLGHTHQEEDAEGYTNLGSYAFSHRGAHSHLFVSEHGEIERRVQPANG